mgnify:FL=1
MYEGWSHIDFNVTQILLIVVLVQAAMPISTGLIKFFDMFNPADDEPVSTMRYSAAAVSGNAANYADEDAAAVGAATTHPQTAETGAKVWNIFRRKFGKKK